uniref:Ribosomal protein S7 n=1 Tax=Nitzschia supralitorea TaxID=303403 RepID=A0A8F0WHW2_9STRA|nr:ribosomal protein S7 [Nitzschia supralitorea]QWM93251.1 ribosomal protein S7 [Nitzschia supralitorea]
MIKSKKSNNPGLKNQIVNVFTKNGKKCTGEKILLNVSKSLQKSTKKNFQNLVQLAVINSTPAFKLNEQTMKKGKRKSKKIIPSFIIKDSLRIMRALKSLKIIASKDRTHSFYESFGKEILDSSSFKGQSAEQKSKVLNQILLNKRYLAKFRW